MKEVIQGSFWINIYNWAKRDKVFGIKKYCIYIINIPKKVVCDIIKLKIERKIKQKWLIMEKL